MTHIRIDVADAVGTITIDRPGLDVEYTYSTPLISEIFRSKGFVSCSSTTFAEAPGNGSHTSAIGTMVRWAT